jgi:hypothetical protein
MFSDATLRSTTEVQHQQYMTGAATIESALPNITCRKLWPPKIKKARERVPRPLGGNYWWIFSLPLELRAPNHMR